MESPQPQALSLPLVKGLPIAASVLLVEFLAPLLSGNLLPLAVTLVIRILQMGVMLSGILFWNRNSAPFSIDKEVLLRALIRGLIWSVAFGLLAGMVGLALVLAGTSPLALLGKAPVSSVTQLLLLFLTGAFVGPIAEEFFFRGIVFGVLRPLGMIPALGISTLLFAAAHGFSGPIPMTQIVGGLLFGLAYEKERHILVPIVIHVLGNSVLFTLACI